MIETLKHVAHWVKSFDTVANWELVAMDNKTVTIDIEGDVIKLVRKEIAEQYEKEKK